MKLRPIHREYLRLLEDSKASASFPLALNNSEVAAKLGCAPTTILRIIGQLEDAGLVVADRQQGRAPRVHPAPDPAWELEKKLCPPDPGIVALFASGQLTFDSTFGDLLRVMSGEQKPPTKLSV